MIVNSVSAMTAQSENADILAELSRHAERRQVVAHPFLQRIRKEPLAKAQVAVIVGQYWHPIHYFTEFLPRVIAVVQDIPMRTFVSKILWQELGEGDPERAHENLYLETMAKAGFDVGDVRHAPALSASTRLVEGYRDSTMCPNAAIGALYGTEVIDLAMVSSLGAAVRNASGLDELSWVDIHVRQEPDHVSCVNETVRLSLTDAERRGIVEGAQTIWTLWSEFYSAIEEEIKAAH